MLVTSDKIGEGYLSRSGKSLMLKIDKHPSTTSKEFHYIPLKSLEQFMANKKETVPVFLVRH